MKKLHAINCDKFNILFLSGFCIHEINWEIVYGSSTKLQCKAIETLLAAVQYAVQL